MYQGRAKRRTLLYSVIRHSLLSVVRAGSVRNSRASIARLEMVSAAVERLTGRIDGSRTAPPKDHIMEPSPIVRYSTAHMVVE
jgi:hypothetical protein